MDRTAVAKELVLLAKTLKAEDGIHRDVAEEVMEKNKTLNHIWEDINQQLQQIVELAGQIDRAEDRGEDVEDDRDSVLRKVKALETDLLLASRQLEKIVKALYLFKLDVEKDE